jgi:hypothetical protein
MNKTLSKAVFTIVFSLVAASANANQIQLEFKVDVTNSYGINSLTYYNPPILFDYVISIDDASMDNFTGVHASGNKFSHLIFSSATIPETPFTSEVLANSSIATSPMRLGVNLIRNYSTNFWELGQEGTFESIYLTTNSSSIDSPTSNQSISYQRGIHFNTFDALQSGDTTTSFTSSSFQAYMNTLVGNSSFTFNDTYSITESNQVNTFGYLGNATLLSVTSVAAVPEADTSAMLLTGLGVIGFMVRRRNNSAV